MFFKKLLLIPLGLSLISAFNFSKQEFLFSDNQQISLVTEVKEEKDFQVWLDEKFVKEPNSTYLTNNDLNFHFYGKGDFSKFEKLEKINMNLKDNNDYITEIKFGENNKIVNEIFFQFNNLQRIIGLEYLLNLEMLELGNYFGYGQIEEASLDINKVNKNIQSIIIGDNYMKGEINLTNFFNLNKLILSGANNGNNNKDLTVMLNKKYENNLPSDFNLNGTNIIYDYATKDINDWLLKQENSTTRLEYDKDSNENFEKLIGNGDFSNFKELKEIDLHGNGINGINFLNNNLITDVDLNDNNLQGEIDLSKLINLNILKLKENPELTKIKLNIKYKNNNVVDWEIDNWSNVEYVDYNNSDNNKSKSKVWVFILIAFLIILIFGICFYFYNKNKNKIS